MGLRHGLTVASLGDIATRRHDQLQELTDDDHVIYARSQFTSTDTLTVVNSAVETDLFNTTLLGGVIGANQGLALYSVGSWLNNTLAAQTGTWRLHLTGEGAAIFATGAISLAQSATRRSWQCLWYLLRPFDLGGVEGYARFAITDVTPAGTGVIEAAVRAVRTADAAVNWNAAVTLRLTIQLGVADANLEAVLNIAHFQHLR